MHGSSQEPAWHEDIWEMNTSMATGAQWSATHQMPGTQDPRRHFTDTAPFPWRLHQTWSPAQPGAGGAQKLQIPKPYLGTGIRDTGEGFGAGRPSVRASLLLML